MSSEEDILSDSVPDSPPNPNRLNVVMFRTVKRKVKQTIEVDSDSSDYSFQEHKKISTQQNVKQTIEVDSDSSKLSFEEENKKSTPPKRELLKRRLQDDENKAFINDKRRRVAEWVKQAATGQSTERSGKKKEEKKKSTQQEVKQTIEVDSDSSEQSFQEVEKRSTPPKRKLLKRRLPDDVNKSFINEKRRRLAEWVKQVATGQSTGRSGKETKSSHGVKPVRFRPHVKCQICKKKQKNIWRHMRLMHDSENGNKAEKKVMSKSGYVVRICPITDCGMIVERMKDHLVRTHKIKRNTKMLERLMKKADPLTEKINSPTSDIIEISSGEECLNVKPIKKERIKPEHVESEDPEDFEQDSIKSFGFMNLDPNNNEITSTETNSVQSLGFVYEPDKREKSSKSKSKETDNSPTKRPTKKSKETDNSPTKRPTKKFKETDDSPIKCPTKKSKETDNSRAKRYFKMIKEKKDLHNKSQKNKILHNFGEYLEAAPNLKSRRTVLQHKHQVTELWTFITPKMTIQDLCTVDKLNEWTGKNMTTLAPGTIRSYLSSMGLFVEYLLEKGLVTHIERFQRFRESLRIIAKKLKSRAKMRRTVVETEEIETMILPVDIQTFLSSEYAQTIEKKIANKSKQVVPSTFYDVRDYMLLRLLQTNAQRPMAVRNITMNSIDRARRTDDGGISITVAKHKTQEGGPAVIHVNAKLYGFLRDYIQMLKIIPGYPVAKEQSIFTTFPKSDGTVSLLTSSQVNKGIQRVWDQGPVNKPVTATRLRKATSTAVRTQIPASREILARHMTHNPETADRHYALYQHRELAVPVTNMIAAVMEGNETQLTKIKNAMNSDNQVVHDIMQEKGSDLRVRVKSDLGNITKSVHWPKDNTDNDSTGTIEYDVPDNIKQYSENKLENMNTSGKSPEECKVKQKKKSQSEKSQEECEVKQKKKSHGRRSFESAESSELIELCNDLILKGNIKKSEVMERVSGTVRGRILLLNLQSRLGCKEIWKKITDRLQTERKRRCKERVSW